jgi:hypothetical protein
LLIVRQEKGAQTRRKLLHDQQRQGQVATRQLVAVR